jgi:hypothetical protein
VVHPATSVDQFTVKYGLIGLMTTRRISPDHVVSTRRRQTAVFATLCGLAAAMLPSGASAQRIENQVAVFAALDKVTARIQKLEVKLGESQKFGALKITPRTCYSRPPTEPPKTTTFVEVEETELDGKQKKLFSGWMFAESPGLNAVEHPVYDVWLTECAGPKTAPVAVGVPRVGSAATKGAAAAQPNAQPAPIDEDANARRRRPPR